jgi:hypothetical protein
MSSSVRSVTEPLLLPDDDDGYACARRAGYRWAVRHRDRGPLYLFGVERVLRGERNVWARMGRVEDADRARGTQHGIEAAHDELFPGSRRTLSDDSAIRPIRTAHD